MAVALAPGCGPRHMAFAPSGRYLYVANELSNTVSVMAYDANSGGLTPIQEISTLPGTFTGRSFASEIRIDPSGRHLYVANRGHDSIAGYSIDEKAGLLTQIAIEPCGGHWPRHFALDPSGEWMVVANEKSSELVVFRRDPRTGRWTATGHRVGIDSPTCVLFVAPPGP